MFANPECTAYANGTENTVYCRVNTPWLSPWQTEQQGWDSIQLNSYPFQIRLWVDYDSAEYEEQPTAGQIIPIDMTVVGPSEEPVPGIVTIFTKD